MTKFWHIAAVVFGFTGLVLGAVGAHAMADAHAAALVDKGAVFQLIHAVLLFALAERTGRAYTLSRWLLLVGMVLFCGSLYLKAFAGLSGLAPLGGVSLMLGWLSLAFTRRA